MIPSEQVIAAWPAQVPAMRPGPPSEVGPRAVAPPTRRGVPAALVYAVLCGVLGLLVAPVLLGPAAIVGGAAGEHLRHGGARGAGAVAVLAAVVGGLVTVLALR